MPALNESVKEYRRWDVPHPIPYQGSKRNLAPSFSRTFHATSTVLLNPLQDRLRSPWPLPIDSWPIGS